MSIYERARRMQRKLRLRLTREEYRRLILGHWVFRVR